MAEELGKIVEVDGKTECAFPGPSSLLELDSFPSLSERKVGYLRALVRAAQQGRLEASCLRSLPTEEALAGLKELPGIGHFSAELILLRGAGVPDRLPIHEPRLARAVAMAYGLRETPTAEELAEISEKWRPYRTCGGLARENHAGRRDRRDCRQAKKPAIRCGQRIVPRSGRHPTASRTGQRAPSPISLR